MMTEACQIGSSAPSRATEGPAGEFCPLCGDRGQFRGERNGFALRECCGVLLSWQWCSVEEYESTYTKGDYHFGDQLREGQSPSLTRDTQHLTAARCRLELLRQWKPSGRLLDVGCGTGAFVAAAAAFGYQAVGADPSRELVSFGRRIGRELRVGDWRDAGGEWDVITLHDVLEHLVDPLACLVRLSGLLAPGGLLVVEWPEFQAPNPAWEKHVRPLQHIHLWSDSAARELFRRAGLRLELMYRPLRGTLGKAGYYLARG